MGCCQGRHKFEQGDEFGDAYNNYIALNEKFHEKYNYMKNLQDKVKKRQFYANNNLKSLNQELLQSRIDREQAYRKLGNIYDRLKDSNSLGKDTEIKSQLFEELQNARELEKEKMEADLQDMFTSHVEMFKDD
jgi:hypothetical protein